MIHAVTATAITPLNTSRTGTRTTSRVPRSDAELHVQYARTRDPQLREQLVERYLPLARFAATRFARNREPMDDLVQVASLALLKAIDRYDPDNGAAFSSYALPTMLGEIRRHFRDRGWAVRPPRGLQEQVLVIERVVRELNTSLGHTPTVQEIADAAHLSIEDVLEARQALEGRQPTSLHTTSADNDDETGSIERRLGVVDYGFEQAEHRATIEDLCQILRPREREIVRLRFEEDMTQAEIGEVVGLSQMHVSRTLRDALVRLRAHAHVGAA